MNKSSISYVGLIVNIGMDVYKKTYKLVAIVDGQSVKKWTSSAKQKEIIERLLRFFPGAKIRTACEAGFSGFSFHRELDQAGIENIVVNAASIEVAADDRVKTDKRDAKKLAELLSLGRLKGISREIPKTMRKLALRRS